MINKFKVIFTSRNILEYIISLTFIFFVIYLRFATLPSRTININEDNSVTITTEFTDIIDYKKFILIMIIMLVFIVLKLTIIKFNFINFNIILFLKLSILLTFSFVLISTIILLIVKFYNLYEYSIWSRRLVILLSILFFYFLRYTLYKNEELIPYLLSCFMYIFPTFILGILVDIGFLWFFLFLLVIPMLPTSLIKFVNYLLFEYKYNVFIFILLGFILSLILLTGQAEAASKISWGKIFSAVSGGTVTGIMVDQHFFVENRFGDNVLPNLNGQSIAKVKIIEKFDMFGTKKSSTTITYYTDQSKSIKK
jgi:hypothetical protein